MKILKFPFLLLLAMFAGLTFAQNENEGVSASREEFSAESSYLSSTDNVQEHNLTKDVKPDKNLAERPSYSKTKKNSKFKTVLKTVKEIKSKVRGGGVDGMTILLIILAIILPPLAVGIYEGITGRFWLVLVLWLLGWVVTGLLFFIVGGLAGLCALVAIVLALLIVLGAW